MLLLMKAMPLLASDLHAAAKQQYHGHGGSKGQLHDLLHKAAARCRCDAWQQQGQPAAPTS
jgi:hypothetical protein